MASQIAFAQGLRKNNYAFVLFYRATCPHCERFAPIVKAYANAHHVFVYAYTLDGKILRDFPQSIVPTRQIFDTFFHSPLGITVPRLFLVFVNSLAIYPVSAGELSYGQLSDRMGELLS